MATERHLKNLYHRMINDMGDFVKSTGSQPNRVLMTKMAFEQLKENSQMQEKNGEWYFEGAPVTVTNNINKVWVFV